MKQIIANYPCGHCGELKHVCYNCHNCEQHCSCAAASFDADELGLDPETDNTPNAESRHA